MIYKTAGNATIASNRMSGGPGSSTGPFIISADGRDVISGNTGYGWTISVPSSSQQSGIYSPNN